LIVIPRQRLDGGQADLLSNVFSRKPDTLRYSQASPDITNHDGSDDLQHFAERIPAAGNGFSHGRVETISWISHRRRYLQRYEPDNSRQGLIQLTISASKP
jgi:hypothetical protein